MSMLRSIRRPFVAFVLAAAAVTAAGEPLTSAPATPPARAESGEQHVAPTKGPARDLAAVLEPIRAKHRVPALAAALIVGEEVIAIGAAGSRRAGFDEPVKRDDRWHLGSCTKAMTATLIAILVEDGVLEWTTTIADAFPELTAEADPAWGKVTLRQLVHNVGGVPGELDAGGLWAKLWANDVDPRTKRLELVRGVLAYPPSSVPGSKELYSNGGFSIAGAIAEKITDRPFERLMQERLFQPLGIASAGFGAPGKAVASDEPADQPRGHKRNGTPVEPGPNADNPSAISPAGRVHMTLEDWARFVGLHLRGSQANPNREARLLKPESFDELHRGATLSDGTTTKYGAGWGLASRPWAGGQVLTHNGSNTMWMATVWIAPARDFAVIACTNVGRAEGAAATDDAVGAVIREHQRADPAPK